MQRRLGQVQQFLCPVSSGKQSWIERINGTTNALLLDLLEPLCAIQDCKANYCQQYSNARRYILTKKTCTLPYISTRTLIANVFGYRKKFGRTFLNVNLSPVHDKVKTG